MKKNKIFTTYKQMDKSADSNKESLPDIQGASLRIDWVLAVRGFVELERR